LTGLRRIQQKLFNEDINPAKELERLICCHILDKSDGINDDLDYSGTDEEEKCKQKKRTARKSMPRKKK
jgi:hypothetical protein